MSLTYQSFPRQIFSAGKKFAAVGIAVASIIGVSSAASAAASTLVVTPTTSQGWVLNPDPTTATTYEFTTDEASIGNGSVYAGPIDNLPDGKDKFIAAKELKVPVSDVASLSYDFQIAGDGTAADANQFYMNVYATVVNDDRFYDCRYDYVATVGSNSSFTTATVTPSTVPTNVARSSTARIATCPATLDQLSPGFVRAITINMGDTSTSDTDLAGYFDKVVFDIAGNQTTYDFETMPYVATTKDECKNGGWMNFQAGYKNQGQCVASVASGGRNL